MRLYKIPGNAEGMWEASGVTPLPSREKPEQRSEGPEPVAPARQECAPWPLGEAGLEAASTENPQGLL